MLFRQSLLKSVAAVALTLTVPSLALADGKLPVVASFSILGDMVEQIGGEHVDVTTLVGHDGDAHVYQPTPADARAVNSTKLLFVNGLEFEGWMSRLIEASGFKGEPVVATNGIEAIPFGEGHAFEWAGTFDLAAGTYKWSFAKVDGGYADPAMRMVILESGDIEASEEQAEALLEAEAADAKKDGDTLVAQEMAYSLNFDDAKDMTIFTVEIKKAGQYTFFTEHMPFEFEANEHFFKDLARADVEPIAQEPDMGGHDDHHGHDDHADHKDHDDHKGHDDHADHKDHDDHKGHDDHADHADHKDHDEHEGHDDHAGHHHGQFDPHAWQSLDNAVVYAQNITMALKKADPANAAAYDANSTAFISELQALDAELTAKFASLPEDKRTIVTGHDAFGYLAAEYNLSFVAPVGMSTEAEASAAGVAALITQIREENIGAVFIESISDSRLLEQIVSETNAKIGGTIYSDALSGEDGPAATYLDMMRHNSGLILKTLSPNS